MNYVKIGEEKGNLSIKMISRNIIIINVSDMRWMDFSNIQDDNLYIQYIYQSQISNYNKPMEPNENQHGFSKSFKKKMFKTPIKIRNQIKQLEVKFQRHPKYIVENLNKNPSQPLLFRGQRQKVNHENNENHTNKRKTTFRSPIRQNYFSSQKDRNHIYITNRAKSPVGIAPTSRKFERQAAVRTVGNKKYKQAALEDDNRFKPVPNQEQQDLQKLKVENEKYKKIYRHSVQKMQRLEKKLRQIKQSHQHEKVMLQNTMETLKKKIDNKKINIGHLYSYDAKGNFLSVPDKMITQTDNQNSSQNVQIAKKILVSHNDSYLSIQSK